MRKMPVYLGKSKRNKPKPRRPDLPSMREGQNTIPRMPAKPQQPSPQDNLKNVMRKKAVSGRLRGGPYKE